MRARQEVILPSTNTKSRLRRSVHPEGPGGPATPARVPQAGEPLCCAAPLVQTLHAPVRTTSARGLAVWAAALPPHVPVRVLLVDRGARCSGVRGCQDSKHGESTGHSDRHTIFIEIVAGQVRITALITVYARERYDACQGIRSRHASAPEIVCPAPFRARQCRHLRATHCGYSLPRAPR